MANPKIASLTRKDIVLAAKTFKATRRMPNKVLAAEYQTVLLDEKQLIPKVGELRHQDFFPL